MVNYATWRIIMISARVGVMNVTWRVLHVTFQRPIIDDFQTSSRIRAAHTMQWYLTDTSFFLF